MERMERLASLCDSKRKQALNFCEDKLKSGRISITGLYEGTKLDSSRRLFDSVSFDSSSFDRRNSDSGSDDSNGNGGESLGSYGSREEESIPVESCYAMGDHGELLQLRTEKGGLWRYCDVSHLFVTSSIPNLVKDYLAPIPYKNMKLLYFGLEQCFANQDSHNKEGEPLPVRTLSIRIRPDIMGGVVMDAVQNAFLELQEPKAVVVKRQGGHFQGMVADESAPYVIDAQLCIARSQVMERQLILSVFHLEDEESFRELGIIDSYRNKEYDEYFGDDSLFPINLQLREASSLLQSMVMKRRGSPSSSADINEIPSPKDSSKATTAYLIENFTSCPSVRVARKTRQKEPYLLLPALSFDDCTVLQASWLMCFRIWNELAKTNCGFHTLTTVPLGTTGPLLDAHFCSNIRQLSRQSMLEELHMTNQDLERDGNRAESALANFQSIMDKTFLRYNLVRHALLPASDDKKVETPTSACPPGFSIVAARASDQAEDDPNNPASQADEVIRLVYEKFSKLDDKELKAYFQAKNAELVDRLAQIQSHQRAVINSLEESQSQASLSAAKEFFTLAQNAVNTKGRRFAAARVPLFEFEVSDGVCYVTASRILFSIKKGTMFEKTLLYDFSLVEFELVSRNLSIEISVKQQKEYTFRPTSIHAKRLKMFLDSLKSIPSSERLSLSEGEGASIVTISNE